MLIPVLLQYVFFSSIGVTSLRKSKCFHTCHSCLEVKQFSSWLDHSFSNGKRKGIMRSERGATHLGMSDHNLVHTGLKREQLLCHNTKGDGNNGNTSPEDITSLHCCDACVWKNVRVEPCLWQRLRVLSLVLPIMGDSMKLQVLLCGT